MNQIKDFYGRVLYKFDTTAVRDFYGQIEYNNLEELFTDPYANYFCKKFFTYLNQKDRIEYLKRHSEFLIFDFPKSYYFRVLDDRLAIHWAVIRAEDGKWSVYFINVEGRAFDKLIFKSKKIAQRRLRKNKFFFYKFTSSRYCITYFITLRCKICFCRIQYFFKTFLICNKISLFNCI